MSITKRFKAEMKSLDRMNPNITVFIVYGLLYDVFLNIYKPFAVKFLERLGGTEFHIALFNSLPGLSALVLLIGAVLIAHRRSKKMITAVFFLCSRFFILAIAFVPMFPERLRPLVFLAFIAAMNLPEAVAQTSLQNFLGDIFDGRVRATAITLRNKFGNIAVPVVTLVTGVIIGILPKDDTERIAYYQLFYAFAFVISVLEIFTFLGFNEDAEGVPEKPQSQPVNLKAVKEIILEPKFRRFLLASIVYQFVWQAGWPLSSIYLIKTLGSDELWLAAFAVVTGLFSFLSAGPWNRLIYKRGNEFAIALAALATGGTMFTFALAVNRPLMLLASAFSGVATIGINCTLLNGLLGATPSNNRIIAIAVYNTFVNISLFLSPFAANALLERTGIVNSILVVGAGRALAAAILLVVSRRRAADSA